MKNGRKILIAVGVIVILLLLAALSIPNLMRSRIAANEASMEGKLHSAHMEQEPTTVNFSGASADGRQPSNTTDAAIAVLEKKLVRNADLGLFVADVRNVADQIQKLTEANHGEIDKLEIMESTSGSLSATIIVRVPTSGMTSAIDAFKQLAVRIEHEQISARDVTREFYDNEAHLRNLHAEEQQYLGILKQAHTVKDTLEVSEKLSDVRDRIERLQTQIQVMTHDIDMSVVTIVLMQESNAQVFGIHWRPLYEAKLAVHDLLAGLGEWFDWVVAAVIKLPLIILWLGTVIVIVWACWRVIRFLWRRFFKPKTVTVQ